MIMMMISGEVEVNSFVNSITLEAKFGDEP